MPLRLNSFTFEHPTVVYSIMIYMYNGRALIISEIFTIYMYCFCGKTILCYPSGCQIVRITDKPAQSTHVCVYVPVCVPVI